MPTHHKGPAREDRALDAFIKLSRANERLNARLNQALIAFGITPGQLAVLEVLLHLGTLSQRVLARKLLRSDANVTTVIDNLERQGWVRRERSKEDRRVVLVSLTAEGRRKIERIFPEHARRIAELMSGLSPDEQETLGRLCKKLGLSIDDE